MLAHSFNLIALSAVLSLPNAAALATPHHHHIARDTSTSYSLVDNFYGPNFYDGFSFFDQPDPTGGLVQYLGLDDAKARNLTHADAGSFVIRADATETLAAGQGRKSTRIVSNKFYGNHVHIIDIGHMPEGLGTWPAYWMTGANWPNQGEIDILEGANDIAPNTYTLHTTPGCTMDGMTNRTQLGKIKAQDCNAYANGNIGCGVFGQSGLDFGPKFNAAQGGYFAYQKTKDTINIWFWTRYGGNAPAEVRGWLSTVHPETWGTPTATFSSSSTCDLASKLGDMQIIINTDFCGGFAGHTWPHAGGTDACNAYVAANPAEFSAAYWKLYSLRVYE